MNVFEEIYEKNSWGGSESRSGPGAGSIAVRQLAPQLIALVSELGVESVLDVGCGDGFWMPPLPGYIGIDVSTKALAMSAERHPDRTYLLDDGGPYPRCDLVIVRCVIQHLSFADARHLLDRVRESGATWLLATTYAIADNIDITTGTGYWPDMTAEPFNLGEPIRSIEDKGASDWNGGTLGLWQLQGDPWNR